MKPLSFLRARTAAALAAATAVLLPSLAWAHPGHDHSDIPSLIRHPLAGAEHAVAAALVVAMTAGIGALVWKARHARIRHGARLRTDRRG